MSGRQLRRGREGRANGGSDGSEEVVEGEGEDERREREKERKVDHLARPDKVHYFLRISRAILPPAPSSHLRYLASRRIRITVSFSPSLSLLVLRSAPSILRFLLRWFLRGQLSFIYAYFDPSTCRPTRSYELVPSLALSPPPLPRVHFSSFASSPRPASPGHSRSHPPQVR